MHHTNQTGRYRRDGEPATLPGEHRHDECGLRLTAEGRHRVCRCQPPLLERALSRVLARLNTPVVRA